MKAIVINNWLKDVDEMKIDDNAPEPNLGDGQVLVEIRAAALNFFDILQVQGKYQVKPPFPFTPGIEFSGIVIKTGKNCKKSFKPGDKVFGSAQGSFAERVAALSSDVYLIPDGLSFEEAAGLFVTFPTSYAALVIRAKLKKDEWCLVHGAAGGVGIVAVQVANLLGAKVIATGGSSEKLAIAKKFGADYTINYNEKDWQKQVLKITGGKGVDVVYDPVGLIQSSIKCIAWNGRLIVIGFTGGNIEKLPLNLVLLKNISVIGLHWGAYTKNEPERIEEVWNDLLNLLASGKLKSVVYEKIFFGLDSVKDGLKAIASRKTYGKVIIIPSGAMSSKL
ncbi:5660_t:CDS:2 [Funneliformis caledonium]|uniref:5660_t:CDS:1 n=1 Tax=Funneliformis caledonium TaxID=1117310 RepID=A0A9N8W360_9GLOM|nr:5660_t:CDS:2 [Funneliformis caledonium]